MEWNQSRAIHINQNEQFDFKQAVLLSGQVQLNILHLSISKNDKSLVNQNVREDIERLFESIYPKEIPIHKML